MPVLAYCIAEAPSNISIPNAGVRGAPIARVLAGPLQGFVSEFDRSVVKRLSIREAAMEFHRTIQELFRQVAVLPFRFPTVLATEQEIRVHMSEHASEYASTLSRLRNSVQMEIRIGKNARDGEPAESGAKYLQEKQHDWVRLKASAADFRQASEPWVKQWRQREVSHGLHCYLLIPREAVEQFLIRIKKIVLPDNQSARVSGPWPATEFFEVKE
jgi:Gas vesicle synthesis protein GvpL/GvpF